MPFQPVTLQSPRSALHSTAWVCLALAAATLAGFLLEPHTTLLGQAMVYVLAVVLVAYSLPWRASLVCALCAVVAFNFFFVPPRWTFQVESNENLVALGTMSVVALLISHLAASLRRQTEVARLNQQRAQQLQALATALSTAASSDAIMALGQTALDNAFAGPNWIALQGPQATLQTNLSPTSSTVQGMQCCMREAAVIGPGTGRWPGLDAWYLPLGDAQHMAGAACIQPAVAADTAGREHGQAICTLLAQSVWRLQLASSAQQAAQEAQRQQTQSTMLAAIAHDLRTPLATVVGAASSLLTQRDKLSVTEQERLLQSISNEASYLSNVTENTLQLMQIRNSGQALQRDWESMEEIVGTVLARVRQHDPARRIRSKVPNDLPLIQANPVLLAQLLTNLLDNALKYSDEAIDIEVGCDAQHLSVSVKDRGPGIPAEQYESIFEPYTRSDTSGQRGAGLGLAVCRAIAQAHAGTLVVRRRNGGGSSFTLTLPLSPVPTVIQEA